MSSKSHAFTMSAGEFATAPQSRRRLRLPALLAFLLVAALLVGFYDLLLLALGL